jgi:acetyl esterase/lipase
MLSKEAEQSIKRFKSFSVFMSSMYESPGNMSKSKRRFFRWFINLQGILGPKVEGTSHYSLVSYLADITGTTIYVPDYRLGPENKYPAQLEDGVRAFKALINDFNYSSEQITIGGDSAGGNLALITLLKLKEEGKYLPNSLVLLSPWADPAGTGESYNLEMADRDILLGPMIKKVWENNDNLYDGYLNNEDADQNNPLVFPISGNYENCPPIMIQVGTEELLLSDSRTLKEALERDKCIHEYFEWEGMYHVFHIDVNMPETISAFKQIANFLDKYSS